MNAIGPQVISVVIATYNRLALLSDLLGDLAQQQLPAGWDFEVVVTDDGGDPPVGPSLAGHALGDRLAVLRQPNAGPAAARHRSIEASSGSVIVSLDDDMRVASDFLACHLAQHFAGAQVVLGRIDDAHDGLRRPLFHRLHQRYLDAKMTEPGATATGVEFFTGNASFRAECYHAVGGFDVALRRCEDRDLGVRFEAAGYRIVIAPAAVAHHRSDHEETAAWRRRSAEWGALDQGIAQRRGALANSPWRVVRSLPAPFVPVAVAAALAPRAFEPVAGACYRLGQLLDRCRLEGVALQAAAITYAIDYFRGVGRGSANGRMVVRGAVQALRSSARASTGPEVETVPAPVGPAGGTDGEASGPWRRFSQAVAADHAASRHYRARYHGAEVSPFRLPLDALTKVGFQMLVAIRFMRLLRDLHVPLGAQLMSRLIRHLYAAEVHWDAELAPGLAIVHGNGLVISSEARVGPRCILFQHVTLGQSVDPATGLSGGPVLGAGVHVGPGAAILGPVSVGAGSKVMANTVVVGDVPAGVVVKAPDVSFATPRRLQAVGQ